MNADRRRAGSTGVALHAAMAVWLSLSAAAVRADDLLTVYDRAATADTVLGAARHALDAARERVPQARAGLLPTVGLNGNSGRQSGRASFSGSPYVDRDVRNWNWNLQLVQPLVRPVNLFAWQLSEQQFLQAEAQFHQARQDLVLRVAQAYFDVLTATQDLRVAQGQLSAVTQQLALASRNFEIGTATITDVHEADARRGLALAQRIASETALAARHAELERILGSLPDAFTGLRADQALPPPPADGAEAWMDMARMQNPAVLMQEAAVAVAQKDIDRNLAAHAPTMDLTLGYGRNYVSGSIASPADIATRVRSGQVGLVLNIPLYAGGAVSAHVREAEALRYKAQDDLESTRRQVAAQARQAYVALENGHAQLVALAAAVQASRSAVADNKVGYRIGTRINIDVLNAEQQLYAAERELFRTRADILLNSLRLKAAAGTLDETDLASINQLLEGDS